MAAVIEESNVLERVAELLEKEPGSLTPSARVKDLVSDSFLIIEMALELEEVYGVEFEADDVATMETLGDLVELLRRRAP